MKKRLWRHHLPLVVLSVGLTTLIYSLLDSDDWIWLFSMSTAYVGLGLITTTLLLGPWKVLRRRTVPLSFDLRRDIGIWAGLVSLAHVGVGLLVHLRGEPWLYFVDPDGGFPFVRTNLFGGANYMGLVATIIIAVLLALSNDWSLRKLGRRWKTLQRWNYVGFALVVVHGWAYQAVENRPFPFVLIVAAMALVVLTVQLAGFFKRRSSS